MSEEFFKKKYNNIFGEEKSKKLLSMKNFRQDIFIRINLSKISKEEVLKNLKKYRVDFLETEFENIIRIKKNRISLSSTLLNLQGKIYIQNFPSICVVNILSNFISEKNNLRILDMCSSPGSKLTALIDLLKHKKIKFEIDAIEKDEKRIQKILYNLNRQNFLQENIILYNIDSLKFTRKNYDVILVDAPCSGNFISDKSWLKKRNQKGIIERSNLQKKLLEKASKIINKNGIIVYSTCSNEIEENEDNYIYAYKNLKLIPQKIKTKFKFKTFIDFKNKKYNGLECLRFFPPNSKTEAFFISVFKK